ncbi:MAG: hypothetical protein EP346_05410 [Bacteroidetes bacterium]|nr:MAG: hypothetical protein EP346_05410 [Bacteroidota bacterium]
MTIVFLFAVLILALNFLPGLWKERLVGVEKYIWVLWLGLSLIYILLVFGMLHLKVEPRGAYTKQVVSLMLAALTVISFATLSNSWKKIGFIAIALPLLFIQAIIFPVGVTTLSLPISNNRSVELLSGGFMACGESIRVVEYKYLLFKKEVFENSSLCLTGVDKLELGDAEGEVLIYHSGEFDVENPYRYVLPSTLAQPL